MCFSFIEGQIPVPLKVPVVLFQWEFTQFLKFAPNLSTEESVTANSKKEPLDIQKKVVAHVQYMIFLHNEYGDVLPFFTENNKKSSIVDM